MGDFKFLIKLGHPECADKLTKEKIASERDPVSDKFEQKGTWKGP